ncbi:hypothetical protein CKO_02642 [Citrobacter koseri ATCC BAA-895]|uniref:Uncharacterized protein n=1 Tax=Citrobacter koseri (strain ATCC BAA-895 / CDC 4225-83 / SGSC4696) TaxID=290338 RepID=A8AJT6_CITK8|nr:hypothetical protein CKO_02642 [Citrobacter koseri ATCC BAA-895]
MPDGACANRAYECSAIIERPGRIRHLCRYPAFSFLPIPFQRHTLQHHEIISRTTGCELCHVNK